MDQFFLPAVSSFSPGQVLVVQLIAGVPEVAFPSFSDNARFLCHPLFLFISVTKQDDPAIRALTWGLRKPSSCFHYATSFLCESCQAVFSRAEGAEWCSAFVQNRGLTTSLWCPHPSGILKHFLWCLSIFVSALASFLPGSSGSPALAQSSTCWSIPALFTPSSSNTQEPGGSNSLLSIVLVLASYQSVFYYKMLTHSFYVYFKLWRGGKKKEQE